MAYCKRDTQRRPELLGISSTQKDCRKLEVNARGISYPGGGESLRLFDEVT